MVEQNNNTTAAGPEQAPSQTKSGSRRGMFLGALIAVALIAGVSGSLLSTAFGQGFGWQSGGWHGGGFFRGPLTPAQVDDRIERMTKHMAIELDATSDQQVKIANIAKAAAADLRTLRDKAQATRTQAVALLTAPTIDRSAIDRLRTEQMALADTASKRIAQALADTAEVLNPEQRRKIADWVTNGPWWRWHRG